MKNLENPQVYNSIGKELLKEQMIVSTAMPWKIPQELIVCGRQQVV